MTPAFQEMGKLFEAETGVRVEFNFGSSGQLAQQIERGAPVDLFAAANVAFVEDLERLGLVLPETKAVYAQGRITLWTRKDSPFNIRHLDDLARAEVKRIAIANPDRAPYGLAAREALQTAGLWEALQSKLVLAENINQALQYAETGNVEAAIVALSLSIESDGRWTLVPEELHAPIQQVFAVIKGAKHEREAREFAAFVTGPRGAEVLRNFGYVTPGGGRAR